MPAPISPDNTALAANALCLDCGLCCTGRLLSSISVQNHEIPNVRKAGIPLKRKEPGNLFFIQPCVSYGDGVCKIYETKPAKCRDFHCALVRNVLNGIDTLENTRIILADTQKQANQLIAQVEVPKNRRAADLNLHNFLLHQFRKIKKIEKERSLTADEQNFIHDAFNYAKLVDRYFVESQLLIKYASLVQALARSNEPPSNFE